MFPMIVVAGAVSKAVGVGFDSAALVQVDPRNIDMSPNSSYALRVVIADSVRHLLASRVVICNDMSYLLAWQLLDPFQLGSGAVGSWMSLRLVLPRHDRRTPESIRLR